MNKIFASETRVKILSSLRERRKTLSELSKELGVSKPTVLNHISILHSEKAVERIKVGRFVYYRLTRAGRTLLE